MNRYIKVVYEYLRGGVCLHDLDVIVMNVGATKLNL